MTQIISNLEFKQVSNPEDLAVIHQLAAQTWPATYANIISQAQIDFMFEKMYALPALAAQLTEGHTFWIVWRDGQAVGFVSYILSNAAAQVWKIQKLYCLPQKQKSGLGRATIDFVREQIRQQGAKTLILNVNRYNSALHFYQKYGFEIAQTVDIPYYDYVLNDYVMQIAV
ncbi:N-acetylglutamate synthase, GNAT family [Flexibacter flexilis DSM 6793]|uniref:N-acetylglutamate synthase, GNAT family n=1 Tax=Flexibacter flexilis DSM 6793 TaxID=927664 RepID=A0A1I1F2K5_9BACT|nr:GNAT family N-acetyltransferase [Flexibacter flexilis]SFB93162.1 N-acetylglutamate synthase, GNAT family [Flexibacter flexilis DSM 6793]